MPDQKQEQFWKFYWISNKLTERFFSCMHKFVSRGIKFRKLCLSLFWYKNLYTSIHLKLLYIWAEEKIVFLKTIVQKIKNWTRWISIYLPILHNMCKYRSNRFITEKFLEYSDDSLIVGQSEIIINFHTTWIMNPVIVKIEFHPFCWIHLFGAFLCVVHLEKGNFHFSPWYYSSFEEISLKMGQNFSKKTLCRSEELQKKVWARLLNPKSSTLKNRH